jgi:hypothetical protein
MSGKNLGYSNLDESMYNSNVDTGYIIVWDLDDTLVSSSFTWNLPELQESRRSTPRNFERVIGGRVDLNVNAMQILARICQLRERGIIAANIMLTNNSSTVFVSDVLSRINEWVSRNTGITRNVFDWVALRNSPEREGDPETKSIHVIRNMIINLNRYLTPPINTRIDYLQARVFFIDDNPNHVLRYEIPPNHYIQITPPFRVPSYDANGQQTIFNENDRTDYNALLEIPGWNDFTDSVLAHRGGKYKKKKQSMRKTLKLNQTKVRKSRSKPSRYAL